jgi:hypothetical protein
MIGFQLLGGLLLCVAFYQASRMWMLDRDLQSYRAPDAAGAWFVFVPARWQRRLYRPEAHPMIADAWKAMALMYATAWAGALLVALGSTSPHAPVRMVDTDLEAVECQQPASSRYGTVLPPGQWPGGGECK